MRKGQFEKYTATNNSLPLYYAVLYNIKQLFKLE